MAEVVSDPSLSYLDRHRITIQMAKDGTVNGNKTMKALLLRKHGGLEELQVVSDHPVPAAVEGHVVIRVGASSFNYHDVFTVRGMPGKDEIRQRRQDLEPDLRHGDTQPFAAGDDPIARVLEPGSRGGVPAGRYVGDQGMPGLPPRAGGEDEDSTGDKESPA